MKKGIFLVEEEVERITNKTKTVRHLDQERLKAVIAIVTSYQSLPCLLHKQ